MSIDVCVNSMDVCMNIVEGMRVNAYTVWIYVCTSREYLYKCINSMDICMH